MSSMDIRQLPAMIKRQIPTARLPVNYEAAAVAIRECVRVDECKQWQDQATAIASYARQAKDSSMFDAATTIKNRAWRRLGELLETQFPNMKPSERSKETGISKALTVGSVNVKNVPERVFEARLTESPVPGPRKISIDYAKEQRKATDVEEEPAESFDPVPVLDWEERRLARALDWLRSSAVPSYLNPAEVADLINSDEDYGCDWRDMVDFVHSVDALIPKPQGLGETMSNPKPTYGNRIPNPIPQWREVEKARFDPACAKALTDLERVTTVDEYSFSDWMRANESKLKCRFSFSDEWDDQAGAWLRFEYVRALGRIP